MLSMEGRCKTLDSRADGYARSEGCGVLLLSTLAPQAYTYQAGPCAVIVGSAVNQVRFTAVLVKEYVEIQWQHVEIQLKWLFKWLEIQERRGSCVLQY